MPESPQTLRNVDTELVVGLVGAVGTELSRVRDLVTASLRFMRYDTHVVKVSQDVITLFGIPEHDINNAGERIEAFMDAGNNARKGSRDNSILALGAAAKIAEYREKTAGVERKPIPRTSFIIESLKRPEEVERLRQTYPSGFVLLGVHCDEKRRLEFLKSQHISDERARKLIQRDANENREKYGQRLEKTFYLSDFFVRLDGRDDKLRGDIQRIVELLFGHPFRTPSFDEYAMFFAFAAALRSADLSRQVGAVIARDKQILATGANDCPKSGGGLYWPEYGDGELLVDTPDGRDYMRGFDSNRKVQNDIIDSLVSLGLERGLEETALREVLGSGKSPIRDLTEYGRVVHAEMDAITSCGRAGIPTAGATLYSTTFPCHNCAKHIVAAGIERVVYIEPYEKSRASEFHQDSITFGDCAASGGRVCFEPFVGIGPRRFFDLFSLNLSSGYDVVRKAKDDDAGKKKDWNPEDARPRLQMLPSSYLDLELEAMDLFEQKKEMRRG